MPRKAKSDVIEAPAPAPPESEAASVPEVGEPPPDACIGFASRGEQRCTIHDYPFPHWICDGDLMIEEDTNAEVAEQCVGPGAPWNPPTWTEMCFECGRREWDHDEEHIAFAKQMAYRFCICGAPGALHFRGGPCEAEKLPGEQFDCDGFVLDAREETPQMWNWAGETYEGKRVLNHELSFSGTVGLKADRPAHKALWETMRVGKEMLVQVTLEIVSTGAHRPIRESGYIVGLAEQRKAKVVSVPWETEGEDDTAGLPLFEAPASLSQRLGQTWEVDANDIAELRDWLDLQAPDDESGLLPLLMRIAAVLPPDAPAAQPSALDESLAIAGEPDQEAPQ